MKSATRQRNFTDQCRRRTAYAFVVGRVLDSRTGNSPRGCALERSQLPERILQCSQGGRIGEAMKKLVTSVIIAFLVIGIVMYVLRSDAASEWAHDLHNGQ